MTDQFVYFVGWLHLTLYGVLAVAGLGVGCAGAGLWLLEKWMKQRAIYSECIAFIRDRIKADPETYRRFF